MDTFLVRAIVEQHIETPGHGYDQLVKLFVRVSASFSAARYIVKVIDSLDFEGYVIVAFDKGQIATRVVNLG
jgi:hypothetical protein